MPDCQHTRSRCSERSQKLLHGRRPVSMHQHALSKVTTEPVLGAVPEHAEHFACCPSDVNKALCNTTKYSTYAESWQPSFSRLQAASKERDMHSVEIDCILADHDFASECAISAEEIAKTQGPLETPSSAAADSQASSAAAATADSQASHLPASTPAIRIDAGFFKSYAQRIKKQREMLRCSSGL